MVVIALEFLNWFCDFLRFTLCASATLPPKLQNTQLFWADLANEKARPKSLVLSNCKGIQCIFAVSINQKKLWVSLLGCLKLSSSWSCLVCSVRSVKHRSTNQLISEIKCENKCRLSCETKCISRHYAHNIINLLQCSIISPYFSLLGKAISSIHSL